MSRARPILFSGEMVRALLAGRKTQTRRLAKNVPVDTKGKGTRRVDPERDAAELRRYIELCPYGVPGDRLWLKESLRRLDWEGLSKGAVQYVADGEVPWDVSIPCQWVWQRRVLPSIHCPRGLSRITLEVTEVRVERLQDISLDDALAEGVSVPRCSCEVCYRTGAICPADGTSLIEAYCKLWDTINGDRAPWARNPWVWVVSFRWFGT